MRALLTACVELDTLAVDVYALLADATKDAELAGIFRQLQAEERDHLKWWGDVRRRVDVGELFPTQTAAHVTAYMNAIVSTLRSMISTIPELRSDDDMLALAASLEFFALDPVFGQLIRQSDPLDGDRRLREYDAHINRLVETMEARRSWALAPHIALLRASSGPSSPLGSAELHDSITGLPLKPIAEEALTELCSDAGRDDEFISLAVLDLELNPLYQRDSVRAERELLNMVSAITPLLRFTDLLARIDTHCFVVVMPATSASMAKMIVMEIADAVSAIATAASDGVASEWVVAAAVTLVPGYRCNGGVAFAAAENLLGDVHASGDSFGARELS